MKNCYCALLYCCSATWF